MDQNKNNESKKINDKLYTICILVMLVPMIAVFAMTLYAPMDKKTVSAKENRTLVSKPEFNKDAVLNGQFMVQSEAFLGDHVYGRNQMVSIAADLEKFLKKDMEMSVVKTTNENKEIGEDYIVKDDRIVALFVPEEEYVKNFVDNVNQIYDMIPEGIDKYMVATPTRIEFEEEELRKYAESQFNLQNYFYDNVAEDVTTIDCYAEMQNAVRTLGINEIYYRTDHHWTHLGSFFAANAILFGMGCDLLNIEDYEKVEKGNIFRGYLVSMHEKETYHIESDNFVYYSVGTERKEKVYGLEGKDITDCEEGYVTDPDRAGYYTFVQGLFQYAVLDGGNQEGDNLMIIMDSYTDASATWLSERFHKVVLVDPRLYTGGKQGLLDLIEEYDINKFSVNIGTIVGGTYYSEKLAQLCE